MLHVHNKNVHFYNKNKVYQFDTLDFNEIYTKLKKFRNNLLLHITQSKSKECFYKLSYI